MRQGRAKFVALLLVGSMVAGSAFGQQTPAPVQSGQPPPTADSDPAFMTGLRRIGVMAGQVVQCTPEADRKTPIADAMDLANQIALHFGLGAAFSFVGAVGYGAGKPFAQAGCPQAIDGWNGVKQKYLNR